MLKNNVQKNVIYGSIRHLIIKYLTFGFSLKILPETLIFEVTEIEEFLAVGYGLIIIILLKLQKGLSNINICKRWL